TTTFTYSYTAPPPSFSFEHDKERRLFRLTGADGKIEFFRDNPTRYLVVEPDGKSGEMRPATKHGQPVYLWLCREEREVGREGGEWRVAGGGGGPRGGREGRPGGAHSGG